MIQNEVLSAIAARRSCRAYKPDLPKPEELQAVLTAGTWAPTAMNRQSPCIVAVQDKATRDKLSAINAAIMGVQSDPFYGAPVVLVVLADASIPTCVEDGSLVMGNLLLAASSLGLGSCWIQGRLRQAEDGRSTEAFCKHLLALPEDWALEAILSLGIPAETPPPHTLEEADWGKVTFL